MRTNIVVVERGRLHAVASDSNSPATTYTCALYGFCFPGWEENQLLQSHSCPVVSVVQGKEVIKSIFNELSVLLPQGEKRIGFLCIRCICLHSDRALL
ncbi:AraC family transcriptional regulator [Salmonella enterica subsp. enterica]|uniref:AraC family transcriptional regulator n=1 Tax=Salmonella enterica I TaxID=59201 RepID=A0A447MTH3_SALET|nr:AraC family transcriptional regulator [Salmonella enterica subsp. enterica]